MKDKNQRLIELNNVQQKLDEAKEQLFKYEEILDSLQDIIFEIDLDGNLLYFNKPAFKFFGVNEKDYVNHKDIFQVLIDEDIPRAKQNMLNLIQTKKSSAIEYTAKRYADGFEFPILVRATPIFARNGEPSKIRGSISNITQRKEYEERLRFLSLHDPLTGLYNRSFFEYQLQKIKKNKTSSVGLIICDLDGLKLINDTLGHKAGDSLLIHLAKIFKRTFRKNDLVFRIGGDEFAILLPNCNEVEIKKVSHRLQQAVVKHNSKNPERPLTISIGYSIQDKAPVNIESLFKEADDNMYREKLFQNQNNRNAIVQTLIKALDTRDYITEGHVDRMQSLVALINRYCSSINCDANKLLALAQFHDIGKVGVPDHILFKAAPLTPEEIYEMRRHCELGHRIAMAAPDLSHIAELILKHHEWWNGQGYPLGLKETDIPIECRVLAIADAYDAMTNDRPYRKAWHHEQAIKEIKANSGTQFDPFLVNRFIEALDQKKLS